MTLVTVMEVVWMAAMLTMSCICAWMSRFNRCFLVLFLRFQVLMLFGAVSASMCGRFSWMIGFMIRFIVSSDLWTFFTSVEVYNDIQRRKGGYMRIVGTAYQTFMVNNLYSQKRKHLAKLAGDYIYSFNRNIAAIPGLDIVYGVGAE